MDVTLRPFSELPYNAYNVYWDIVSEDDWKKREAEMEAVAARERAEAERTVDQLTFGEQQPEVDHELKAAHSKTGDYRDRKWRDASDRGFIEFRMEVLSGVDQVLRCTYSGDERKRVFDILVDGKVIATQKLDRNKPGEFVYIDYPLPEVANGKDAIIVRLKARPNSVAGAIYQCAIMRASP